MRIWINKQLNTMSKQSRIAWLALIIIIAGNVIGCKKEESTTNTTTTSTTTTGGTTAGITTNMEVITLFIEGLNPSTSNWLDYQNPQGCTMGMMTYSSVGLQHYYTNSADTNWWGYPKELHLDTAKLQPFQTLIMTKTPLGNGGYRYFVKASSYSTKMACNPAYADDRGVKFDVQFNFEDTDGDLTNNTSIKMTIVNAGNGVDQTHGWIGSFTPTLQNGGSVSTWYVKKYYASGTESNKYGALAFGIKDANSANIITGKLYYKK